MTRHHVYPRRHFKRSRNVKLQRTIFWICRSCHDALERIIRLWELTIQRLWTHLNFYTWVIDAFLEAVDPERDLEPVAYADVRQSALPWK